MRNEKIYDKLCAIDDSGRAEALAENPTVFCGQCGARAYDPDAVCDPLALSGQEGTGGRSRNG